MSKTESSEEKPYERYQSLSEGKIEKKRQYVRERYKNLLEDEHRNIFLECKK